MIPRSLEDAFEVGTIEEYRAWLASIDEGYLLLDSVDEARLRSPMDFAEAVRIIGNRIREAKDRAYIVLTGRTQASRYTRLAAIRALTSLAPAELADVREALLNEDGNPDRELLAELIASADANAKAREWLIAAIKVAPKRKYSVDRLDDAVCEFARKVPSDELPLLIDSISALLDRPPFIERGYCEASAEYAWLMNAAATAIERVLKERNAYAFNANCHNILYKFRAVQQWKDDLKDIKADFSRLVSEWSELNRALLWYDVRVTRERFHSKRKDRLISFWQASIFGSFWKFSASDFDYAVECISTMDEPDDKLVALSLAFTIFNENGSRRSWRERLKAAVDGNEELKQRLELFLNPPPQEHSKEERKYKRQAAARAKRRTEQYERSRRYILDNVETLRDPKLDNPTDISKTQWYLHQEIREASEASSNRWTDGEWRELVPAYGEAVARAYRDGALRYWRRYRPQLQSEGAEPNSTPIMVIFGLTGLAIEARETGSWEQSLTPNDVALACRYAVLELNGFPVWFPRLYAAYSDIASQVLLKEVEYELSRAKADTEIHYVLSDISWSAEWAWDSLAPRLTDLVKDKEPLNSSTLKKLLRVISGSSTISNEALAALAKQKCSVIGDVQSLGQWFAVWIGVDPSEGIKALARKLAALQSEEDKTNLAMIFVTNLWGGRRSEGLRARTEFRQPEHLQRIYILMNDYIRPSEDIRRENGGVFSPGIRDDAQDARNRILNVIVEIPGKEAFLALQDIARSRSQENNSTWLQKLCLQKAQADADMPAWSITQVREFHERLDRTPANHKELAQLAILRLLDLKDDMEEGDESVAQILQKVQEETLMRNFMAHELRNKAFGRYLITQEEEMADAKRPDLRFHVNGVDSPVPVELKLADSWTGPDLFERFETQLMGDYLRDRRSSHGIFALVHNGKKNGWDLPNGKRVDFESLVAALKDHWAAISKYWPGIDEITVVGIDLTKRFR